MPRVPSSILAILELQQQFLDSDLVQYSNRLAAEAEHLIQSLDLERYSKMAKEAESIYFEYRPMIEEANRYSREAMRGFEDYFGPTTELDPAPRTRALPTPPQNRAAPESAKPLHKPRPEIEILKGSDLSELMAELEQIQRSEQKMVFLLVPSETKCPDPFLKLIQDGQWSLYVKNSGDHESGRRQIESMPTAGNASLADLDLDENMQLMIQWLGDHGAFDSKSKRTHKQILAASDCFTEDTLKKASADLSRQGIIQTGEGCRGGCWLNSIGRQCYESKNST
jgi:hypothetical protein